MSDLGNYCSTNGIGGFVSCAPLVTPIEGYNMAPWIKVAFGSQQGNEDLDAMITVGNQSSPQDGNTASVKSMEYGLTDGTKCKIEIVDEQGGSFTKFADRLIKCMGNASQSNVMQVQFGWTITNCDGSVDYSHKSPIITFCVGNMEVSFNEGVIKYNITALDLGQISFAGREDKAYGSDAAGQKLELKAAMQKMMSDNEPKMNLIYGSMQHGQFQPNWDWKNPAPKSAWTTDNQNKLGTISRWVQPFRTSKDKGLLLTWDNTVPRPTCILWEDPGLGCDENVDCGPYTVIGTFVVNGGKCSNVLSFSPNVNWFTAFTSFGTGGNAGGAHTAGGRSSQNFLPNGGCRQQTQNTGLMRSIEITRQSVDTHGHKNALNQTEISGTAHSIANAQREGVQPIEAELRIQGNPDINYVDIKSIMGKHVSVVVINPFSIQNNQVDGMSPGYMDWQMLADTSYNDILSNRFWMIKGVNHQIKEGSYITTLKLNLPAPGIDIAAGRPMGGDTQFGWTPPNSNCPTGGTWE